jgi:ABC-type glycerol-3-phosphate transport system substrate-binding protein
LTEELASAVVSGGVYYAQQANFPGFRWGPLPGPEGPAPPVAWGWAFVVPTQDSQRLSNAALLVNWLTAPDVRGWTVLANYIPAWPADLDESAPAALDTEPSRDYSEFLRRLLDSATSVERPEDWGNVWAAATANVLRGAPVDDSLAELAP